MVSLIIINFISEENMKKLALLLASLLIGAMFATAAYASAGGDLLASADVHMSFENGIKDDNDNYKIISDGNTPVVAGKFGSGVNCQGGVNYLTVDGWKFGADSFTFTAWIICNERDSDSDPAIVGSKYWDSGSNIGWVLSARDNDWKYNANSETGQRTDFEYSYYDSPLEDVNGVWYHIAVVVDRAKEVYTLYVNGVSQGETDFSDKGHAGETYDDEGNGYTFNIGDDGSGIYNSKFTFNFDYDEVAVFKRALTADEVIAIYEYDPIADLAVEEVPVAEEAPAAEAPAAEAPAPVAEAAPAAPAAAAQTGNSAAIVILALAAVGCAVAAKRR